MPVLKPCKSGLIHMAGGFDKSIRMEERGEALVVAQGSDSKDGCLRMRSLEARLKRTHRKEGRDTDLWF